MAVEAIESTDGYNGSNYANESIEPHELVTDTPGTGVELVDGTEGYWDGIAVSYQSAPWIHDDSEDTSALEYDGSSGTLTENDRVPYGGNNDGDVIRPLTISETNSGVTTAPSISEGDVVGVPDTTDADAPSDPGRLVEEGYSNDENDDSTSTTFNRSNNNFLPVGIALPQGDGQLSVTGYGEQFRVQVRKDLLD